MLQDRCIGVFDLESPELDAFSKSHVDILTLLASQAAVAIENARLYEKIRSNEVRLEKEIRFAQRVQAGLLPVELPKRMKSVDVAARLEPARGLGGDFYDFLAPEPSSLVVAVGDVSGKGVAAALYSAFAGELVRSRTFRRRYAPERFTPSGVLLSSNTILYERQLEEYYCTLCYALFDVKRRVVTIANSGLPYPVRCSGDAIGPVEIPGVPLGLFPGIDLRRDRPSTSCRATSTSSAPTACTTRRTSADGSSATIGCSRSWRRRGSVPRARSSTRSSRPSRSSAATRRRMTT